MDKRSSFSASYDRRADTLYITKAVVAERGVQDEFGIWRYDDHGQIVGVTITDFQEAWETGSGALLNLIASRLEISRVEGRALLEKGLAVPSDR